MGRVKSREGFTLFLALFDEIIDGVVFQKD